MSIHPKLPPRRDSCQDQEEATCTASYEARREKVLRQRREREKHQRPDEARANHQRRNESKESNREGGILFDKGDKALDDWTSRASTSSYDDFLVEDHYTADDVVQSLFGALTRMKQERDEAISLISTLIEERTRARAHMSAQGEAYDQTGLLYRKVGLAHDCPDFLLKAARLAFRKELHPDVQPGDRRADAEQRFKEAEAAFEEITRLRGH